MIVTQLFVSELTGEDRLNEPAHIGIPLPMGAHHNPKSFELSTSEQPHVPAYFSVASRWPDSSIKWLFCDFIISLAANEKKNLALVANTNDTHTAERPDITEDETTLSLTTAGHRFCFDKKQFRVTHYRLRNEEIISTSDLHLEATSAGGAVLANRIDEIDTSGLGNDIRPRITISGKLHTETQGEEAKLACRFQCVIRLLQQSGHIQLDIRIHNPNRSEHENGIWDLGDQGSVLFDSIVLCVNQNVNDANYQYRLSDQHDWTDTQNQSTLIYQESSGGENWKSPTHVNQSLKVPHETKGYICTNGIDEQLTGLRASPSILMRSLGENNFFHLEHFWQNFPSAIRINRKECRLELFPANYPEPMELQGGEAKTYTALFDFATSANAMRGAKSNIQVTIPSAAYAKSDALPFFCADDTPDPIESIISKGLDGENNYFFKREKIDLYGWRHFGELYADHEAIYATDDDTFVSHYNNQYDSIYGFVRMFAKTGDTRWFQLFDELARHVADIDIYQTHEDRDEYNGGLFWHTDHYLKAFACTHRTYSRHQNNGQVEGGGPGAEHCYTSGLLYHYLITGSPFSRMAMITLRTWIEKINEGSGTLLESIFDIKNNDIPKYMAALRGQHFNPFKYPLTRGTGNYISTILDSYELSSDQEELDKVDAIIRNTLHPNEDVSLRDLRNIEKTWSYLILLQALIKFINIKRKSKLIDDAFFYARDCLLNFADWMLENEHPYLENPDILEYPNDTWVAQDLRKAYVLFAASQFEKNYQKQDAMKRKARHIHQYVYDKLSSSSESACSRHLAILMQNDGPYGCLSHSGRKMDQASLASIKHPDFKYPSSTRILCISLTKLLKALSKLSIMNELRWLSFRSNKAASLLHKLKAKRSSN